MKWNENVRLYVGVHKLFQKYKIWFETNEVMGAFF